MDRTPKPKADVLLVTVTDVETDAVRDILNQRFGRSFSSIFLPDFDMASKPIPFK